jgi:hypothetical protein
MILGTLTCLLAAGVVQAAEPAPDRPLATAGGYLVASRTLELEVGGLWKQGFTVPARVKFGAGKYFEPRVAVDLSGIDQRRPGLALEGKIGIAQQEGIGLSAFVASAFPVADDERWYGTVRALMSLPIKSATLRANAGVDLGAKEGGGIAFGGVPVLVAMEVPFGRTIGSWLEAGTVVEAAWQHAIFDGGLTWRVTDILVGDAGVGWDLAADSPFVTVGLTANLGRVGG